MQQQDTIVPEGFAGTRSALILNTSQAEQARQLSTSRSGERVYWRNLTLKIRADLECLQCSSSIRFRQAMRKMWAGMNLRQPDRAFSSIHSPQRLWRQLGKSRQLRQK